MLGKDFVLCFDAFVPLWKITAVLRQMHDHYVAPDHQLAVRRFAARLFEARCRDDPGADGRAALLCFFHSPLKKKNYPGAADLLALMRETLAAAPTARHLTLIKIVRARRAAERCVGAACFSRSRSFLSCSFFAAARSPLLRWASSWSFRPRRWPTR